MLFVKLKIPEIFNDCFFLARCRLSDYKNRFRTKRKPVSKNYDKMVEFSIMVYNQKHLNIPLIPLRDHH